MRSPRFLFRVSLLIVCSNVAYIASFFFCAGALGVHMAVGGCDRRRGYDSGFRGADFRRRVGAEGRRSRHPLCAAGRRCGAFDGVSVLFGLVLTVLGGFGAIIWMTSAYRRIPSSPAEGANVGEVRWGPLPASADCIEGKAA
jgi:hypothetical protein